MADPKIEIAKFKKAEERAEGFIEGHPRLVLIGLGCVGVITGWLLVKAFA